MDELRPIPGYEGLYSVTEDGRAWSHPKTSGFHVGHNGMWLRAATNEFGYLVVCLARAGRRQMMKVHRAVALAWIANPADLPVVNHKDGDKTRNVVVNLEWCTQVENIKHGYRTGLNPTRGVHVDDDGIRRALAAGRTGKSIASEFNVSNATVSVIKTGKHRPCRPTIHKGKSNAV